MRTPAVLLAIPLTIGCAIGLLVAEHASPSLAFCAAASAFIALIAGVGSLAVEEDAVHDCTASLVAGALLVGVSAGASAAFDAYRSPLFTWFQSARPGAAPVVLHGVLRDDAALTPLGVSLGLDVLDVEPCAFRDTRESDSRKTCRVPGGARLSVAGQLAAPVVGQWRAGRSVRVPATLREPTTYRNPGVPDEQRALARRGIALVGSVKSAALVEVVAAGSPVEEAAGAFRAWVRLVLERSVASWSPRSAGVAAAILIGDRTGLAEDDEERLQAAGTYHVIAISGGNIAILTVFLLTVGRWLGVASRVSAATTIAVLFAYGEVTGPAPSVNRAIAAAVIFLVGRLLEHRVPSVNVLAVAAMLGLTVAPAAVLDPGFLLSFGATLGILLGVPKLTRSIALSGERPRRTTIPWRIALRAILTLLAATAAAELALGPLTAALFGRITCAGLLLNLAAIPLMSVVQIGSLATLAAWTIDPQIARACGYVVHLAAAGLIDSARLLDVVPWLSREIAPPSWWLVVGYYLALTLTFASIRIARVRLARVAVCMAALFATVIVMGPHATARDAVPLPPAGVMRVVFLDVGQGDATLLVLPDRRAFLIDAGGLPAAPLQDPADGPAFDVGDRVVAPALRAFGVRSLDTLILTHADSDHIGGASAVMKRFLPRAVWEGVPVPPNASLRWLGKVATGVRAEWRRVQAGDELRVAGVVLRVLHPPLPEWERQRVRNDDSVVIEARMGSVEVVLPGDVGREGENRLRGHVDVAPLTVLKVPHHGSATSSSYELLEQLRPVVAIVSAGRNNRFGHPAKVVVDRYRSLGATLLSTAEEGVIVLDTDGERVELSTWSGKQLTLSAQAGSR